jgi:hypothetical protein
MTLYLQETEVYIKRKTIINLPVELDFNPRQSLC